MVGCDGGFGHLGGGGVGHGDFAADDGLVFEDAVLGSVVIVIGVGHRVAGSALRHGEAFLRETAGLRRGFWGTVEDVGGQLAFSSNNFRIHRLLIHHRQEERDDLVGEDGGGGSRQDGEGEGSEAHCDGSSSDRRSE